MYLDGERSAFLDRIPCLERLGGRYELLFCHEHVALHHVTEWRAGRLLLYPLRDRLRFVVASKEDLESDQGDLRVDVVGLQTQRGAQRSGRVRVVAIQCLRARQAVSRDRRLAL